MLHGVHGHTHNDEDGRTSEIKIHIQSLGKPPGQIGIQEISDERESADLESSDHKFWKHRHSSKIDRAHQCDAREHTIYEVGRVFPRSYSGYESSVLSQIVCDIGRIKNNRHIKIGEENDGGNVEQVVKGHAHSELHGYVLDERHLDHLGDRGGDCNDGSSEYDRDNPSRIHSQRQMGALSPIDFPADHSLGIGDRYSPLPSLHKHNGNDDRQHQGQEEKHPQRGHITRTNSGQNTLYAAGKTDNNPCKDDERNAVSDPSIRDLFSQPHDKNCPSGHRQDRQKPESPTWIRNDGKITCWASEAFQEYADTKGLDQAD